MNFLCFIQSSLYHKQITWGYNVTEFNLPYDAWEYKTLNRNNKTVFSNNKDQLKTKFFVYNLPRRSTVGEL